MKKIFTILALFILSSCVSKYKTSILLKTEKYEYKINYPEQWSLFYGSTDASMYELSDGSFLHAIAVITKQSPKKDVTRDKGVIVSKAIGGTIQIFVLDKNSVAFQDLSKSIESGFDILSANFSDIKNDKTYIPLKDIYNWFDNDKNNSKMLSVILSIEENKVILFTFHGFSYSKNYSYSNYSKEEKQKILKEFYKIINSLKRVKIN